MIILPRLKSRLFPLAWIAVSISIANAEDWPTFRGVGRTAVVTDGKLLESWPTEGPQLLWTAAGAGRGYASPAIAAGRIYTLGDGLSTATDKDEYLSCYDVNGGKQIWKTKTGPAWNKGSTEWQSSRSTPTVDGNLVYVISPQGVLLCCQTSDGKEVWRKDLMGELQGKKGDSWGYSESVLIDGDRVICTPGGTQATMVALDKLTGTLIWKSVVPDDRGAGHASIVISEVGGTRVYVQSTASGPFGVAAKDGKLLWSYPVEKITAVIPTPIVKGDMVLFVAGYNTGGGALLLQVPGVNGAVTIKEIYPMKLELRNKHGGVVLVGDHIYADSDASGTPYCADFLTGEIKWKKRGSGKDSASMIAADGRLYIRFSDGTMVLAKADPSDFTEISSFKIPDSGARPSWAHPVIVDGKLYLREQDKILCYNIRAS